MRCPVLRGIMLAAIVMLAFAAPSAAAEPGETVAQIRKAVDEFCPAVFRKTEVSVVAKRVGALAKADWRPEQQAWISKAMPDRAVYSLPLERGALAMQARVPSMPDLPPATYYCNVVLFDVTATESDRVYAALEQLFASKGYARGPKDSRVTPKWAEYIGERRSLFVLFSGPEKDGSKYGPQVHIRMMKSF